MQEQFAYDRFNHLTYEKEQRNRFNYDAFGRCLQFSDNEGVHFLLYQGDKEIGSWLNGKLHDFRLVNPHASQEAVFAIELKQKVFFPLQDFRHHICALQKEDGTLAQWTRYSTFGKEEL